MRGIEERLRQGMIDATRPVLGAPELAVRVTARVALRRRRRRLAASAAAAAAAVLVAIGVVSPYIVTRPDPVAASPELDGVRIGYIPEGLGAPQRLRAQEKDVKGEIRLRGEALRWQAGSDFVQVSAYRTDGGMRDAMDIMAMNVVDSPVEPRSIDDPVLSGDGTSAMWVADHRLVLKVTVSAALKGERDRIAGGLRVAGWSPAFAGLRVTYMPAGMWVSGTIGANLDALTRLWQGESGQRVSIEVVYGRAVATLEKLRAAGPPQEVLTDVRPASVHGQPAYAGATGQAGRVLLWLVKPGIGVRVRGDHLPEGDLVRIAEGIQSPPEGQGESVDGIAISLVGPDLRPGPVETAMTARWRSTTRRWIGSDGEDTVTVSIQRGAAVPSATWWSSVSRGEPKPATIAGVHGNLLDMGASTPSRKFTWTPESGLAIVVTAPADDLRRIVRGIAAP
ncbi:hypothetical protein ACQPYK_01025 [Streptosporangium sp. CA-135522]|uniref:hypothetical protein n=1 Tax=Streptosporangium sp. CA-135522 TaxID=3240072 RepID=UPI003D932CEF